MKSAEWFEASTEEERVEIQRKVARKVRLEPLDDVDAVAGVDVSYRGEEYRAAAVVLDPETYEVLDRRVVHGTTDVPYEPGFLAFREGPPALEALEGLDFDLLFVHGHGVAHPRRAGLASHLGVALDVPTIGVARRPLVGRSKEEPSRIGDTTPLVHRGEVVGYLVRTDAEARPVVVSPGHRCNLEDAVRWTLRLVRVGKWPEPLRLADLLSRRGASRVEGESRGAGVRR
ncbi:endonuclease V [Methanopyrus kandleri]|uniref:Endonuclease V n=2 Tax=Methanopyrus kandleri TaxID=2320 RepID=NFI_METKA|nr:endonuclease V [Methanopyrus kandleri]Q8X260.1 RecName: Full=Endonuclease V; AltName: Full=Deoxyinosine 3'endonuclease; AltName: Full=Deoxyribonuclease V; Short=DNase V [Methanopyrus kandleri AV19]AAL61958.1 putative endonuclease V [Methanopyrus kandleri]AAM02648.1 Deoxyinosine 3'endonuclease (endonuclease V) [Methanopyrus kandleri AV19]HII70233.1 endonuclease V [Methanopyrus kandleri]